MTLLGLAGPAEAGIAVAFGLLFLGLVLVAIMTAIALARRSRKATVTSLVVLGVLTLLFTPWDAFWPVESGDSDVHSAMASFRMLARMWVSVIVATVATAAWVYWGKDARRLPGWAGLIGVGLLCSGCIWSCAGDRWLAPVDKGFAAA